MITYCITPRLLGKEMKMNRRILMLFLITAIFSGSSLQAGVTKDYGEKGGRDQAETDIRKAMDAYARQYANLRPIEERFPDDYQLVQLCLLLDTSNSMDGLILQAKSQLWKIVNELSGVHKDGKDIRLEVALYEYGNDNLSLSSGYIRQVTPFTENLDLLSEALFSLETNGGSEYCGHVIGSSLNRLQWNRSDEGLKMIFIAGNEPFDQGSVNFRVSCGWAAERDIFVNTIYCGDYQTGVNTLWKTGATIGKGNYFAIDSDRLTRVIETPYDDDLIMLNSRMNRTYVPYGKRGKESLARQSEQDANASGLSQSIYAGRAATKGSKLYKASDWDLVDALEDTLVTVDELEKEYLPEELKKMTTQELSSYVQKKKKERKAVKQQINDISRKRDHYIRNKEMEGDEASLGSSIVKSLRDQAETKNFSFK